MVRLHSTAPNNQKLGEEKSRSLCQFWPHSVNCVHHAAHSAAQFRHVFRHALTSPAKLRQLRERVCNPITLNAFDVLTPIQGAPYPHLVRREALAVSFEKRVELIAMAHYVDEGYSIQNVGLSRGKLTQ